jgi:phospholipid/cholesterol/gamma-HCH transport system permease protein
VSQAGGQTLGGIGAVGRGVMEFVGQFGGIAALTWDVIVSLLRGPREWTLIIQQLRVVGVQSMSIAFLTAAATGMIFAVQFGWGLRRFGASLYAGKLVSIAFVMELGPVLTSLVVGARIGAGITAELGSMRVTEQIDAIRALGANPVGKLVAPRVIACTLAIPILVMMADLIGTIAAMFITMASVGVSARFYWDQVLTTVGIGDLCHGLIKSVFFGYVIGVLGCFYGLRTWGGTQGVGRSTTEAVVSIAITILIADFLLTKMLLPIL